MNASWLTHDKTFDNYSQKEIVSLMRVFLYIIPAISVVLAVIDFIFGFTEIAVTTLTVPVFCWISLILLNKGRLNQSMIIIIAVMVISTTVICILGYRIHEVGIIIFPVIVFFSSLIMNLRGVIVTTTVVILCLAIIVFGEQFGFLAESDAHEALWVDLIVALTVIVFHTFLTFGFSNITRKNLKRTRDELQIQKEYKKQIEENLIEKTELLRLVHHRVKNNLLLVNSLIELETYGKPEVKEELKEVTESIHTIARAHDPLYHTDDYKQVEIKPYLEKLIATFIQSNVIKGLEVDFEDCLIFHEKALLLGIILQKILSSMGSLEGMELAIELKTKGNHLELWIVNQNVQNFSLTDTSLIHLLTKKMNGTIEIAEREISISFNASKDEMEC